MCRFSHVHIQRCVCSENECKVLDRAMCHKQMHNYETQLSDEQGLTSLASVKNWSQIHMHMPFSPNSQ